MEGVASTYLEHKQTLISHSIANRKSNVLTEILLLVLNKKDNTIISSDHIGQNQGTNIENQYLLIKAIANRIIIVKFAINFCIRCVN